MNSSVALAGVGTALVTPFLADGSLDHASLRSLAEWQIVSGVSLLVACGSTGEAATLSEDETLEVVEAVVEVAAGRVPVFAGCTHNSTAEAVRRAKLLAALPGISGILTANPYYSKPNQRGQFLHFKAIADAVAPLPVLLYNIPSRTAANLEPQTALELAKACGNIAGVKESSGDLEQIGTLIADAPPELAVLAGDDHLAVSVMRAGGKGVVSVLSNALPETAVRVVAAAQKGSWQEAQDVAGRVAPLVASLFAEPNPAPIKSLLHAIGRIATPEVRLPMVPVPQPLQARLLELYKQVDA